MRPVPSRPHQQVLELSQPGEHRGRAPDHALHRGLGHDEPHPDPALELPQEPEFEMGGGGLYSTAGDYLKFVRMMLNQGRSDKGEAVLKPAIERAAQAGVRFTSEILIGNVAHEIVERAQKGGCDGIVMGTRGMGALGNLVLGSVATKVVHLTKLPVTLVK